jgi:signal peptidase I
VEDQLHIQRYDQNPYPFMTQASYNTLKGYSGVTVTPNIRQPGETDYVYPTNPQHPVGPPSLDLPGKPHDYHWNVDNYGPIIIPNWIVLLIPFMSVV